MISESWYWKRPLLEMAARLRSLTTSGDLSEEQFVQVERDVFIGFYSVRKLLEAITKITDATKAMKVQVDWYPNKAAVSWRNNHKLDELYDFDTTRSEIRDIKFVCGRIIHSFIFTPCLGESGLAGILFTSDTDKDSRLYFLAVDRLIDIFERVGNDNPKEIHWSKDDVSGEETTIVN
jgi:hypothetical protein